jgi:hypothetical protein
MIILPKLLYRFHTIFDQISPNFFAEIDKMIKSQMKMQQTHNGQNKFKQNNVGKFMLSDFKTYYTATVTNAVC